MDELLKEDMIPHAIIGKSPSSLAEYLKIKLIISRDGLDEFEGAALSINRGPRFALKHYRGYPAETTTIYLPHYIQRLDQISSTIMLIADALHIPKSWIVWERKNDPDL
jgi:hypothetical protein